jgi:hypothetical protein
MTDDHLSDEQLSGYLDDERDEPSTAHVATCARCRRRLSALADARSLVRRPVAPVPPSVRAAAVESALAEGLSSEPGAPPSPVVPLVHRRARISPVLVGVAAAVAVVVVAVSVSLGRSHAGTPSAASTATSRSAPHASASSGGSTTALSAPAGVADLGSLPSESALRAALAHPPLNGADTQSASLPAATGAPAKSAAPSGGDFGIAGVGATQLTPCVAAAQRAAGSGSVVALVATATYIHVPAVVVEVEGPTPPADGSAVRRVIVVARTGCRVLANTSL